MTKYIDRYYLNGEEYGIKFGGWGWQPWANTILYLPIDDSDTSSTVYDHSTNQSDFSWYWTAWYETLASGKKVITLSWSNWIYIDDDIITAQPKTISLWHYRDWNQSNDWSIFVSQNDNPWPRWLIVAYTNNNNWMSAFYGDNADWRNYGNRFNPLDQTWYNMVVVLNSNTITLYVNWNQETTGSWSTPVFTGIPANSFWFTRSNNRNTNTRFMSWKLGSVIIEDKAWTSDEITDYFNQTKSLYGIS